MSPSSGTPRTRQQDPHATWPQVAQPWGPQGRPVCCARDISRRLAPLPRGGCSRHPRALRSPQRCHRPGLPLRGLPHFICSLRSFPQGPRPLGQAPPPARTGRSAGLGRSKPGAQPPRARAEGPHRAQLLPSGEGTRAAFLQHPPLRGAEVQPSRERPSKGTMSPLPRLKGTPPKGPTACPQTRSRVAMRGSGGQMGSAG